MNDEQDMTYVINFQVIDAVRKVRDGYIDQAKFADPEPAAYFREFIRRIDAALSVGLITGKL